jgi:hypothetical protein
MVQEIHYTSLTTENSYMDISNYLLYLYPFGCSSFVQIPCLNKLLISSVGLPKKNMDWGFQYMESPSRVNT